LLARSRRTEASTFTETPHRALGFAEFGVLVLGGIVTRRIEATGGIDPACGHLLIQRRRGIPDRPSREWRRIWEGSRPGDPGERFMLYERNPRRGTVARGPGIGER